MSMRKLHCDCEVKQIFDNYLWPLMFPSESEDGNASDNDDYENERLNFDELVNEIVKCSDGETEAGIKKI